MVWLIALALIAFLLYAFMVLVLVVSMFIIWLWRLPAAWRNRDKPKPPQKVPEVIDNRSKGRLRPRRIFYRARQVNRHWRR
jgi:hypothetical protein